MIPGIPPESNLVAPQVTIFRDNKSLFSNYGSLKTGDIVCNRIRMKRGEEYLLVDLLDRGVRLIPSATSQLVSRSKTMQVRLFADLMAPHTVAIYDLHELLETVCFYQRQGVGRVVVKHDRKNGGLGVHLFRDVEDVYTQAANEVVAFPFVLQPYHRNAGDIRVILVGDYLEAYTRTNPDNFRNNLHWGGDSRVWQLDDEQLTICRDVMNRGSFPYGHIDLMVTEDQKSYLAEINLNGGIKGASVSAAELKERKVKVAEQLVDNLLRP